MRWLNTFVVALALATPAAGQMRSLGVPNDNGWQHARTGLVLWGKFGAFERDDLRDNGTGELDISTTYRTADRKTTATIYLYRPGLVDVPLWFDRSHTAVLLNPTIKASGPANVVRFAPPGSATQSALRVVYPVAGRAGSATGLAMIPFGEWLVKVRLTSDAMEPAALDAALLDVIGKIRWPASIAQAKVATPVQPCPAKLKFRKAKPIPPDLGQAMLASVLGIAVRDKKDAPGFVPGNLADYCLEANAGPEYSVYRAAASTTNYVIAIGDSGAVAFVGPEFSLTGDKGRFGVSVTDKDSSDNYPAFSAMPSPQQVVEMIENDPPDRQRRSRRQDGHRRPARPIGSGGIDWGDQQARNSRRGHAQSGPHQYIGQEVVLARQLRGGDGGGRSGHGDERGRIIGQDRAGDRHRPRAMARRHRSQAPVAAIALFQSIAILARAGPVDPVLDQQFEQGAERMGGQHPHAGAANPCIVACQPGGDH